MGIAPHIHLDAEGNAWVDDSGIRVVEIAGMYDLGADVETIKNQLYWMSSEQVEAALSYYHEHKAVFDRVVAEHEQRLQAWQQEFGKSPLQIRLELLKYGR